MMNRLLLPVVLVSLTACSSQRVIVDQRYSDMSNYSRDLAECQTYADQVPTGEEVGKGAAGGAVVGGALGAILENRDVKRGAGAGAVVGGVRGGSRSKAEKDRVIKNCLRNRGYKVLN